LVDLITCAASDHPRVHSPHSCC